ncbi:MAG: HAD family hydrolase [Lachnospiraceae bacterium]|nr:HAD family hydrolase [Lachnospiraceae bacterium]
MIRTVIFDIDGTLYDFYTADAAAIEAAARYAEEELGVPAEAFLSDWKTVYADFMKEAGQVAAVHNRVIRAERILEKRGLPLCPHVLRISRLYWNTLLDGMVIEDGIADFMAALKEKGIRIGIGSNMTAYIQFIKLERLDLLKYVDFVVTSEEAVYEKPRREFFEFCARKAGCGAEECVFIGDNPEADIAGAAGAGMKAVLYGGESGIRYPDCMPGGGIIRIGDVLIR